MKFNDNLRDCPLCKSDWRGDKIPDDKLHLYPESGSYFSRLIGVELAWDDPKHYDGVSMWRCPDCNAEWDRWTGEEVKKE